MLFSFSLALALSISSASVIMSTSSMSSFTNISILYLFFSSIYIRYRIKSQAFRELQMLAERKKEFRDAKSFGF